MSNHHHTHHWHRVYDYYLAHLRSRYLANARRYRDFYINLYNYLNYNDVD